MMDHRAHTPAAAPARPNDLPPKRPNRQQPLTLEQLPANGFQKARPKLDQASPPALAQRRPQRLTAPPTARSRSSTRRRLTASGRPRRPAETCLTSRGA